jgi:hypothetical protein
MNVMSGVLSGRLYPATTMPPSMPVSIINTFSGFVSFKRLLSE